MPAWHLPSDGVGLGYRGSVRAPCGEAGAAFVSPSLDIGGSAGIRRDRRLASPGVLAWFVRACSSGG